MSVFLSMGDIATDSFAALAVTKRSACHCEERALAKRRSNHKL